MRVIECICIKTNYVVRIHLCNFVWNFLKYFLVELEFSPCEIRALSNKLQCLSLLLSFEESFNITFWLNDSSSNQEFFDV